MPMEVFKYGMDLFLPVIRYLKFYKLRLDVLLDCVLIHSLI